MVAAVAVVNAFGDVRDAQGSIIAGARLPDGTFADTARVLADGPPSFPARPATTESPVGGNTTLAVVATNAALSRSAASELAQAASLEDVFASLAVDDDVDRLGDALANVSAP
jgi:L-aminopeptidase/D-esterase-like protein